MESHAKSWVFLCRRCVELRHQWPRSSSWRSAKKRSPSLLLLLSDAWATVEMWRISSISQLMAGLFPAILQRMARCLWTTQMLPPNFKSLENTRQQHINHFHPFLSITSNKSAASATTPPTNWWLAHTFSHSRAGSHPSRYTWDGRLPPSICFAEKTLMCDSFQSLFHQAIASYEIISITPIKNFADNMFTILQDGSLIPFLSLHNETASFQFQLWRLMGIAMHILGRVP